MPWPVVQKAWSLRSQRFLSRHACESKPLTCLNFGSRRRLTLRTSTVGQFRNTVCLPSLFYTRPPPHSRSYGGPQHRKPPDVVAQDDGRATEFPPNVVAEVREEARHDADTATLPRPPETTPETTGTDELSLEGQDFPPFKRKQHPPPETSIKDRTRSAFESIPTVAVAVMQQQYYVPRHLALRYRAWRHSKSHPAGGEVSRSKGAYRRSPPGSHRRLTHKPSSSSSISRLPLSFVPRQRHENVALLKLKPESDVHPHVTTVQRRDPPRSNEDPGFLKITSISDSARSEPAVEWTGALPSPSVETQLSAGASLDSNTTPGSSLYVSPSSTLAVPTGSSAYPENQLELIRNYESVLQVVLAKGSIGHREKKFLEEYRTCCSINASAHITALTRLGWTLGEFEQGSREPPPGWRKSLKQFQDACDHYGSYIVTAGSIASLSSIMMASMVHLRMMQLAAGCLYFIYNISRRPALLSAAYWNLVFFVINSFMLGRLLFERHPESFTEEELDVFERFFLSAGLPPRQFSRLLQSATWRHVSEGEVLLREGEPIRHLMLLYTGAISLRANDTEVELLEEGDRSAILGVKAFLSKLEGAAHTQIANKNGGGSSSPAAPSMLLQLRVPTDQKPAATTVNEEPSSLPAKDPKQLTAGRVVLEALASDTGRSYGGDEQQQQQQQQQHGRADPVEIHHQDLNVRNADATSTSGSRINRGKSLVDQSSAASQNGAALTTPSVATLEPQHDKMFASSPHHGVPLDSTEPIQTQVPTVSVETSPKIAVPPGCCQHEPSNEDAHVAATSPPPSSLTQNMSAPSIAPSKETPSPKDSLSLNNGSAAPSPATVSETRMTTPPSQERPPPGVTATEDHHLYDSSNLFVASTTAVAVKECKLLVWDIETMVRRVADDPVRLGFPVVGALARSMVVRSHTQSAKQGITNYETLLRAMLSGDELQAHQKIVLREFRERFGVSEDLHWQLVEKYVVFLPSVHGSPVLSRQGWTREEFVDGAKRGSTTLSRGWRALLSAFKEQSLPPGEDSPAACSPRRGGP